MGILLGFGMGICVSVAYHRGWYRKPLIGQNKIPRQKTDPELQVEEAIKYREGIIRAHNIILNNGSVDDLSDMEEALDKAYETKRRDSNEPGIDSISPH